MHRSEYSYLPRLNNFLKLKEATFEVKHSSQYVYFKPSSFLVLQRSSIKSFTWTAYDKHKYIMNREKMSVFIDNSG